MAREAPGYTDIAAHYRRLILDGTLGPGDEMPSYKEATDQFGVAHTTVNRAYRVLKAEGLVLTKPGSKTVVATPNSPGTGSVATRTATGNAPEEHRLLALELADKARELASKGDYEAATAYASVSQAYAAVAAAWVGTETT